MAIMLVSCHKHDEQQTQSTYTFANTTGKRITFDIYNSKEDYYRNTNRMQQYVIAPGANQKIVFEALKTFWIDWYSAEYTLNNWQSDIDHGYASPPTEIEIASVDDNYVISTFGRTDTARSVLLNGGGILSTWQGTVNNSGSLLDGTYRFLFRKDFTGEYTFTNTDGIADIVPFRYFISGGSFSGTIQQSFGVDITTDGFQRIFHMECTVGQFTSQHTGRDTMQTYLTQGTSLSFPIVRQ